MISHFRASQPADAGSISQLFREVFGMRPDHPDLNARQMDWKYWRPHPGWEGSRSFVAERNGKVVAHGAVVPLSCAWGDRRLKMVHLIDWAALPDSPGAGISLLKRIEEMVDGVFVAGGTEMTRKILPALGFREIGKSSSFALPLRPLAILLDGSINSWKPVARFARNLCWRMRARTGIPPGWSLRRLLPGDLTAIRGPHPGAQAAVFERKAPELALFRECPVAPSEFYMVLRDGVPIGHLVLTLAVNQCRIADAWVESSQTDDWNALYILAVRQALAHRHIAEIVTVAGAEPEIRALEQTGFKSRGEVPMVIWSRDGTVPQSIRYQLIDGDGAWLNDGRNAFWS